VTVYRSKGRIRLSSGGFGACVKLVRCAAAEAVGLAVAACVKAEGGTSKFAGTLRKASGHAGDTSSASTRGKR
jgi:hypothetical protein